MKCADPVLCYMDEKGKRRFSHFSLSSHIFKKYLHQQVFNCGKCIHCRRKKSYELAARCVLHASLYKQNSFITLTYDETKETYHNTLDYTDIQKFKKRLRQYVKRKYGKRIEVFNVHEYGKNGKKHWHLILFGHDFSDKIQGKDGKDTEDRTIHTRKNGYPVYTSKTLEKLWPYGFNTVGDVSEASALYQAQYTQKDFKNGNITNGKKSKSNHSGIGRKYFLDHYNQILRLGYIPFKGSKMPLPRYFEKLAHKHWSHFYEPQNFQDHKERKKLYTPFKPGQANKEIADLFANYKILKHDKIKQLTEEWEDFIQNNYEQNVKPDFVFSGENALYDLKNKNNLENF